MAADDSVALGGGPAGPPTGTFNFPAMGAASSGPTIPQVGMGVSSAAQGALSGASLGPWGALAGGVIGAGASIFGQMQANAGAAGSITQQEQFQAMMSNTAYQRSVADMKAAGLNPALMFGSGGPESTPSGGSFTPQNVMEGVQPAISSAFQGALISQQIKSGQADVALKSAQAAGAVAQARLVSASAKDAENRLALSGKESKMNSTWFGYIPAFLNSVLGGTLAPVLQAAH